MLFFDVKCPACSLVKQAGEKTIHLIKTCQGCGEDLQQTVVEVRERILKIRNEKAMQVGQALAPLIKEAKMTPQEFYQEFVVQIGRRPDLWMDIYCKSATTGVRCG